MSSASSSVCVRRRQERKIGERDGESDSMAHREKPGDMKHTETNKSSLFAYCCILIRWLLESVLDVAYHDRGDWNRWARGGKSCGMICKMTANERDRERNLESVWYRWSITISLHLLHELIPELWYPLGPERAICTLQFPPWSSLLPSFQISFTSFSILPYFSPVKLVTDCTCCTFLMHFGCERVCVCDQC